MLATIAGLFRRRLSQLRRVQSAFLSGSGPHLSIGIAGGCDENAVGTEGRPSEMTIGLEVGPVWRPSKWGVLASAAGQ